MKSCTLQADIGTLEIEKNMNISCSEYLENNLAF